MDHDLAALADATRKRMIANGEPCCVNCRFARLPLDTQPYEKQLAGHYVFCEFFQTIDLPDWATRPKPQIVGHMSGQRCRVFAKREGPLREAP